MQDFYQVRLFLKVKKNFRPSNITLIKIGNGQSLQILIQIVKLYLYHSLEASLFNEIIHPLAALAACTVHAADISPHPSGKDHGTIEKGSLANFNILKNDNWESWCLTPGHSPIAGTVLEGNMIIH